MSGQSKRVRSNVRSRRTSSLGRLELGDTGAGLVTMSVSMASRQASQERLKMLARASNDDMDLLHKLWLSYREMSYRHTWVMPLQIVVAVYTSYFLSGNLTPSNRLHMFVAISYQVGGTDQYGKGIKDLCFVFFYTIFFTFLREFLMDMVIRPATLKLNVTSPHRVKRMMEQAYSIIYFGVSGPTGLAIMYHSDLWFFRTAAMYRTYPDLTNTYELKAFYLAEAAFWVHQAVVLVLQLEKPRKDYKEMIFHHIVTLLLIWSSYVFHFTKMGLPVYITMDISDFWLSLSMSSNYLNHVLTPVIFVIFVLHWIYLRHWVNLRILWSVLTEFRTEGSFVLNLATQQYKCWIFQPIVFTLIAALQLVNLYWLFLILRILYRLVRQGIQRDERSDSESDDEPVPASSRREAKGQESGPRRRAVKAL